MTEEKKSLCTTTTELIQKHATALYSDKIENQIHHLVLLEALIKVGMEEVK